MARGRSLTEFQKEFPDEASCSAFLFKRRWPDSFVCPFCGGDRAAALKSRAYTFECYGCRRQTSITAATAKELLGFRTGMRESAQSWKEVLVELKARGPFRSPRKSPLATARWDFGGLLDEAFSSYLPTPLPRSAISESMCAWIGLICSA
jgi:hypothetical protein